MTKPTRSVDNSGNAIVTGRSVGTAGGEDYATVKYNPSGTQIWTGRYNGPGNDNDVGNAISVDDQGNIYVTGESYGIGTATDYATLKYSYTVAADESVLPIAYPAFITMTITPEDIKIPPGGRIYDMLGRESSGSQHPGIYFLLINGKIKEKIIKIK